MVCIRETKVVMVGRSGSGKTAVFNAILNTGSVSKKEARRLAALSPIGPPTVGFNVATVGIGAEELPHVWFMRPAVTNAPDFQARFEPTQINLWDVGGGAGDDGFEYFTLWRHFLGGADVVIYCADASDRAGMPRAMEVFREVMTSLFEAAASDGGDAPECVLLLNKCDQSDPVSIAEAVQILGAHQSAPFRSSHPPLGADIEMGEHPPNTTLLAGEEIQLFELPRGQAGVPFAVHACSAMTGEGVAAAFASLRNVRKSRQGMALRAPNGSRWCDNLHRFAWWHCLCCCYQCGGLTPLRLKQWRINCFMWRITPLGCLLPPMP